MKNNEPGHISEVDLDKLMNKAFLELDFDGNPTNKDILGLVAKHALQKPVYFTPPKTYRLDLLFLILSVITCLISVYRLFHPDWNYEGTSVHPVPRFIFIKQTASSLPQVATFSTVSRPKSVSPVISSVSTKDKVVRTTKIKSNRRLKKNNLQPVPDSVHIQQTPLAESSGSEPIPSNLSSEGPTQDTFARMSPNSTAAAPSAASARRVPAVKRSSGEMVSVKSGKNRWWKKLFQRKKGGTFIMKGGKYRKSGRM